MEKKIQRITAGDIVWETELPLRDNSNVQRPRAPKHLSVAEAQRNANQRRSCQQLEMLLAANFPTPGSAVVGVGTFDDDHLPRSRDETLTRFNYFRNTKLRHERAALDLPPPIVIWAPEILTSQNNRWHVHFVVNATGHDYKMLKKLWIYGKITDFKPLRVDEHKNHASLAHYLSKELRDVQDYKGKPGLRSWSCSRNAKRPEVDVMIVDASYELTLPPGCVLLDEEPAVTGFEGHTIKYRTAR